MLPDRLNPRVALRNWLMKPSAAERVARTARVSEAGFLASRFLIDGDGRIAGVDHKALSENLSRTIRGGIQGQGTE